MNRPGAPAGRAGGNSPIAANGRGILLLVIAFVIGVAVLRSTDPGGGASSGAPVRSETSTTKAGRSSTTSLPVTTTPLPARPPGEVKVLPVNGSGIAGVGGKTGDQLRAAGYANTLAAVNSTSDAPASSSTVEFAAGADADALAIAKLLGLQPTAVKPLESPPVDDTRGAEVVVLIGGDIAAALGASASTTSTTEG
ncbi:MAG TPA: LytR C-terminal domain-containing protein [Acidimicrobiales bacterium]